MKKTAKKVLSIVLALVMLVSVCSVSFTSFAQTQKIEMPGIQTMLTDGNALKNYLEGNFLNLEQADKLLSEQLPTLAQALCAQLGDLFFQMGYTEGEYPDNQEALMLALARVIGSLGPDVFREPEKVETTDLSLVYHLAYLSGTQYVETINESLPASLQFDLSEPVLPLSDEQAQQIKTYYARWKAGDLRLDDFDIKDYLGDMSAAQYLKTVLLVFIADEQRLPAIMQKAIDFTLDTAGKHALCNAVNEILTHLTDTPVSALLTVLSDTQFHTVLKALLQVAGKVTVGTDYYAYKVFNEGIYTDENGDLLPFVKRCDNGTYEYVGPSIVSDYTQAVDALCAFLAGIDQPLNDSVLACIFSERWDEFSVLAEALLRAAIATITKQEEKFRSDIQSALAEKSYALAQIENINNGQDRQRRISAAQASLNALAAQIATLQDELLALETQEAVAKDAVKGYYEALAEFEAQLNEQTAATILNDPEYIAAKQTVDETEAALSDNYEAQELLLAQIRTKSEQADAYAALIEQLQNNYLPDDAKAVYQKMVEQANQVIRESEAALASLPDNTVIVQCESVLAAVIGGMLHAFDGVYDTMIKESPMKAALKLFLALQESVDVIENMDWQAIAAVTEPLFEMIDGYIDQAAGVYIGQNGGAYILENLTASVNAFFDEYGVFNYIDADALNAFLSEEVLGDNSEIMQMAAASLAPMFPNVQPTYEGIVSCLVPILSAFDFGAIMDNISQIDRALALASPTAFAYLAGVQDTVLDQAYISKINQNLRSYGYTGSALAPVISLTQRQQSSLLYYVRLEQDGTSLADIAAYGFRWTDYAGNTSSLVIANALIKMALGDSAKLGELAAADGIGTALVNLLCDLLDDIKQNPLNTILDKISNAKDLAALADLAISLFDGPDPDFKSYDLFFSENIYYDGEGNPTFYARFEEGQLSYSGPRMFAHYVPVISAGLDFLDGLNKDVAKNGGDLLKTILFDKMPQLKNLISSVISYQENGEQKPGILFYFLLGYSDYLKNVNEQMSLDVLISLAMADANQKQQQLETVNEKIGLWHQYLQEVEQAEKAEKLAKAKALGVLDASVNVFDEDEVAAAIEQKILQMHADLEAYEVQIGQTEQALIAAQAQLDASSAAYDAADELYNYAFTEPFYTDLCDIFDTQNYSLISQLEEDCKEEFESFYGENAFSLLAGYLADNMENYGSGDDFMEDYLFGEYGFNVYGMMDDAYEAKKQAEQEMSNISRQIAQLQGAVDALQSVLAEFESGAVAQQIAAAGVGIKIFISNDVLKADNYYSAAQINAILDVIDSEQVIPLHDAIAAQQAKALTFEQQKQAVAAQQPAFNEMLIPLAAAAADTIAQGVINIIMGDRADGSENVYYYIMQRRVADILTTGGRLRSLFEMIVGIYEPALNALVSEELLDAQTAAQLVAATPSFEAFYANDLAAFPANFIENPVTAAAKLIHALSNTIKGGFLSLEGELTHDALQIKKINADLGNIFDEAFADDWNNSYSKAIVLRTGEIYRLLVDILGLSFIRELLGDKVGVTGSLSGKIDTSHLYADATVSLCRGTEVVASVLVQKDSDGSFVFNDVPEGSYVLRVEAKSSVPYEISAIDVIADATTDMTDHARDGLDTICLPVGDVTGDTVVNMEDLEKLLLEEVFASDNEQFDINCDGMVDIGDISIVLSANNYSAESTAIVY